MNDIENGCIVLLYPVANNGGSSEELRIPEINFHILQNSRLLCCASPFSIFYKLYEIIIGNNLPASSESATRQGLLAVITSEQIFSRSSEVDKHSVPPKKINCLATDNNFLPIYVGSL